ncbi:MAG: septum formation initiator family protein [Actinomycetia bacterium]|nr:septum formation initiator family protein [Actinomycetes bacterium]
MTDTLDRSETDAAPRRPRRRTGRLRTVLFVVLLVIAGFIVTGVLPVADYLERGTKVAEAQAELDKLVAENGALADDIEALYTEQEVERIAREQYGFVREGEVSYVVIPSDDVEDVVGSPADAAPVAIVEVDRSFLERIWDFVTGNDQSKDG